jgi:hypothetical protein
MASLSHHDPQRNGHYNTIPEKKPGAYGESFYISLLKTATDT